MQSELEALTSDDWDHIEDGLEGLAGEADTQAEMWRGRSRHDRYRRDAERARAVLAKVQAIRAHLHGQEQA